MRQLDYNKTRPILVWKGWVGAMRPGLGHRRLKTGLPQLLELLRPSQMLRCWMMLVVFCQTSHRTAVCWHLLTECLCCLDFWVWEPAKYWCRVIPHMVRGQLKCFWQANLQGFARLVPLPSGLHSLHGFFLLGFVLQNVIKSVSMNCKSEAPKQLDQLVVEIDNIDNYIYIYYIVKAREKVWICGQPPGSLCHSFVWLRGEDFPAPATVPEDTEEAPKPWISWDNRVQHDWSATIGLLVYTWEVMFFSQYGPSQPKHVTFSLKGTACLDPSGVTLNSSRPFLCSIVLEQGHGFTISSASATFWDHECMTIRDIPKHITTLMKNGACEILRIHTKHSSPAA